MSYVTSCDTDKLLNASPHGIPDENLCYLGEIENTNDSFDEVDNDFSSDTCDSIAYHQQHHINSGSDERLEKIHIDTIERLSSDFTSSGSSEEVSVDFKNQFILRVNTEHNKSLLKEKSMNKVNVDRLPLSLPPPPISFNQDKTEDDFIIRRQIRFEEEQKMLILKQLADLADSQVRLFNKQASCQIKIVRAF